MANAPLIETARLKLVPFGDQHISARYVGWLNDPDTMALSRQRLASHTIESCRDYVAGFASSPHYLWAIERKDKPAEHIGNIRANIDTENNTADVAILIGERTCWGTGVGSEAWQGICDWLLGAGGIRKVYAGTTSINKGMLGIMRKCGMIDDGVRTKHYEIGGQEVDVIYAALFRDSK